MSTTNKNLIILFSVLGAVLLLYFISTYNSQKYQWDPSFRGGSDQPYGTSYLKKLLDGGFRPGGELIENKNKSLTDLLDSANLKHPTSYVFVGPSLYLDSADKEALLNFIYAGNDAFIASLEKPNDLISRIYTDECNTSIEYDETEVYSATFNFYHDTLNTRQGVTYTYRYGAENRHYYWGYLNEGAICDSTNSITPLGYFLPEKVNFFKIRYGEGFLYLHTTPIAFTNYFIRQEEKAAYAAGVLSHLQGQNFVWDEKSKIPFMGSNNSDNSSPLYYIMQQPGLKYAWWLLLISVVLYILFVAKRNQRIIPILETKSNTSLEFIKLIASLHYQNGNHHDMAQKKMKYFQYFIRNKYGIHAQNFTADQIKKLSERSKVSVGQIELIVNQYNAIERDSYYNIEAGRLGDFYYAIENFYRHCK